MRGRIIHRVFDNSVCVDTFPNGILNILITTIHNNFLKHKPILHGGVSDMLE